MRLRTQALAAIVDCVYRAAVKHETSLRSLYAAFNARDIDAALARMTADVDWPNGWEGGRVVGHEQIRDYWKRQWARGDSKPCIFAQIDSRAVPAAITERSDDEVEVRVHQVGRDLSGCVLFDEEVRHVYAFRGDLVRRMTIE